MSCNFHTNHEKSHIDSLTSVFNPIIIIIIIIIIILIIIILILIILILILILILVGLKEFSMRLQ